MNRTGFTLLEVIVALALTGLVLLIANALLAGAFDASDALRRSMGRPDGRVAARAWALEACHGLEVGMPGDIGFQGDRDAARFTSRVLGPDGNILPVPVAFQVQGRRLTIAVPAGRFAIADSADELALGFLNGYGSDGAWITAMGSPVSAPVAIRMTWSRSGTVDTLLCPIGSRG